MLQRLVEILEEKSAVVTQEQQTGGTFQTGMSARQVAQFWFLHAINSSLTPLRHILLAKHRHPEEMFREMSRLAGALCTFSLDSSPRSLPAYNHYDPGPGFDLPRGSHYPSPRNYCSVAGGGDSAESGGALFLRG